MPHFNLRYFLETLGKERGGEVFLLQIGAMDGKTFDPVHEYITRFGWQGLLVEPIAEQFERLQATYAGHPGMALANVAIGEQSGKAVMHRIPSHHIADGSVPKWGEGLASFYPDRNALAFADVSPLMVEEEVRCCTLPELLEAQGVTRIDVLQIDAEGNDYHILKQLDFTRFTPLVINFELVNLPKGEQTAAKRLLDAQGYIYQKGGYDLLAVSPQFFAGGAK